MRLRERLSKTSDFILRVDLDNPYYTRRKVTVISHADFASDSIGSIDVTLTYDNVTRARVSMGHRRSSRWTGPACS